MRHLFNWSTNYCSTFSILSVMNRMKLMRSFHRNWIARKVVRGMGAKGNRIFVRRFWHIFATPDIDERYHFTKSFQPMNTCTWHAFHVVIATKLSVPMCHVCVLVAGAWPGESTFKSRWIVTVMLTFKVITLVYHGKRNMATFKYRCCALQLKGG